MLNNGVHHRSNHLCSNQPPCLALGMAARNAIDFLSFIGEGESAQAKNPRRRPQARGRGSSERLNVLSLIGEGEEQPPQPRNSRGRPPARGRGRGSSGRPVASAMEVLAVIGEGDEQPPQARNPVGRPRGRLTGALKYTHLQRGKSQQKVLRFQMRRFNTSGRAVNVDGLMSEAQRAKKGRPPKAKVGKGGWEMYLPETILRMAFSAGRTRHIAASFDDVHRHSQGSNQQSISKLCFPQQSCVCTDNKACPGARPTASVRT